MGRMFLQIATFAENGIVFIGAYLPFCRIFTPEDIQSLPIRFSLAFGQKRTFDSEPFYPVFSIPLVPLFPVPEPLYNKRGSYQH
jgi:hypothetical protein